MKLFSEAAERNKEPISEVLAHFIPASGICLEVSSGSGQHIVHFAKRFSQLRWQPTEISQDKNESIQAYIEQSGLQNINEPLELDVLKEPWPIKEAAMIINFNMIHISPKATCPALFKGSSQILLKEQKLILYGPFKFKDGHTAPSNLEFEARLKEIKPDYGLWFLEDLVDVASKNNFQLLEKIEMPSNNHCLVFQRI